MLRCSSDDGAGLAEDRPAHEIRTLPTEDWLAIYAEHLEKHSRQLERNLAGWTADEDSSFDSIITASPLGRSHHHPRREIAGVGTLISRRCCSGRQPIIRPIILILTLPLTVLTLVFILVVNGIRHARGVDAAGLHDRGLVPAILGSIVVGLTGWFASKFVGSSGRIEQSAASSDGRRLD